MPILESINPLKLMSACQIEKATGINRHVIYKAMDDYEASHGRVGLRFVRLHDSHRRACARSVQSWYDQMERIAARGY